MVSDIEFLTSHDWRTLIVFLDIDKASESICVAPLLEQGAALRLLGRSTLFLEIFYPTVVSQLILETPSAPHKRCCKDFSRALTSTCYFLMLPPSRIQDVNIMCSVYADDICIWVAHKISVLGSALRSVLEMLAVNLRGTTLKLSPKNCNFLHVNHRLTYHPKISPRRCRQPALAHTLSEVSQSRHLRQVFGYTASKRHTAVNQRPQLCTVKVSPHQPRQLAAVTSVTS